MMGVTGSRKKFTSSRSLALAAVIVSLFAEPSRAIELIFDYRYDTHGFFDDPERRDILEWAGQLYTAHIEGTLGAMGTTHFVALFPHPQDVGKKISLADLDVLAQTMVIFVGARPLLEAENRIAIGGPGYVQFHCKKLLGKDDCRNLYAGGPKAQKLRPFLFESVFRSSWSAAIYPPQAFAPWGGTLTFGSDVDWYFGDNSLVPLNRFDFLSSAIHELGHILGIGTAGSWSHLVPLQLFEGTEAVAAHKNPVPLHTDLGHWLPGTSSWANGVPQEAVFTPGLAPGERRLLTELDIAALRDIGWVAEVPNPAFDLKQSYEGERIKGDVNGNGAVSDIDGALVFQHIRAQDNAQASAEGLPVDNSKKKWLTYPIKKRPALLEDPRALAAADIFPMINGKSIGDGSIDESDLDLFRQVVKKIDFDGDGLPTNAENYLNRALGIGAMGHPRYQPLERLADECMLSEAIKSRNRHKHLDELLTFYYCRRDGTPWTISAGLAPGEQNDESVEKSHAPSKPSIDTAPRISDSNPSKIHDELTYGGAIAFPRVRRPTDPPESFPPGPNSESAESRLSQVSSKTSIARTADQYPFPASDAPALSVLLSMGATADTPANPTTKPVARSANPFMQTAHNRLAPAEDLEASQSILAGFSGWITALFESLMRCVDLIFTWTAQAWRSG